MSNTIIQAKYKFIPDDVIIRQYKSVMHQIEIENRRYYPSYTLLEQFEDYADDLLDEIMERGILWKYDELVEKSIDKDREIL